MELSKKLFFIFFCFSIKSYAQSSTDLEGCLSQLSLVHKTSLRKGETYSFIKGTSSLIVRNQNGDVEIRTPSGNTMYLDKGGEGSSSCMASTASSHAIILSLIKKYMQNFNNTSVETNFFSVQSLYQACKGYNTSYNNYPLKDMREAIKKYVLKNKRKDPPMPPGNDRTSIN